MEKNSVSKKTGRSSIPTITWEILPLQMTVPDSFRPLRSQRQNFSPMKMSMHLPLLKSGPKGTKGFLTKKPFCRDTAKWLSFPYDSL